MKKNSLLTTIIKGLGKNNDAAYAVVAVATAKGIFRPMFTMMDKHQDHETKKYTAIREGLTECIAIPCYLGVSWVAKEVVAPLICGKASHNLDAAKKTLSFLGVCAAALIIIPGACSMFMTPIMNFINKKDPKVEPENKLDIVEPKIEVKQELQKPVTQQLQTSNPYSAFTFNSGMKIGGGL